MAETLEKPLQDATTGQRIRAYAAVAARRRRRRGTVAVRTTDAHRRGQRRLRTMDRALAQPRSGDAVRGARAGTHRLAGRQQSVVGTRHRQASFERRRSHRSSRDNFGIDHSGRLSHAEVMADTATTAPDTCFAEFFSALTTVAQTGTTESRPDRALIWVSTWMLMVSPGRARSSCRRDQSVTALVRGIPSASVAGNSSLAPAARACWWVASRSGTSRPKVLRPGWSKSVSSTRISKKKPGCP